jgi:chromosome segregation ATPase
MSTSVVVAYPFTPDALAAKVDVLRGHAFTTPSLYREGTKAIATCRELRVQIEERRKLLKQDSLEYGRKVDAVAKELTAIIEAVESGLKSAKLEVDNEKARLKREAEEAERARVEAEVRAKREAEEAELAERRRAELAQIEAQQAEIAAQRKALEAERKAHAAELAKQRAEQEHQRLAMERERTQHAAELAELRAKREAAEAERRAQEEAARLAAEAEEARINALEYERERQRRLAALKPDLDKLGAWADAVRAAADAFPELTTEAGNGFVSDVCDGLYEQCDTIRSWRP